MMNSGSCNFHPPSLSIVPVIFILTALIIWPSCRQRPPGGVYIKHSEIIVAAAANLTDAFQDLSQQFTKQSGIKVVLSFGSTADLAKQIENGAPFDVFAAADEKHVVGLEQKGLITPGTRAIYARGSLVIWVPPGSTIDLERIEDLTSPRVERIAIAKPDIAPYGEAAVEALRSVSLWTQIEPKVIYGMNVSQVRQFVSSGNVEAGFLPRSMLRIGEGKYIEVEERLHKPIDQALGVVRASVKQDDARRFTEFLLSPAGQALLEEYGYRRPAILE